MKAAVRHEFGPPEVLHLEEVPTPTPGPNEVRIRVRAASVNLGDWELLTGDPWWITFLASVFAKRPRVAVPTRRRSAGRRGLLRPKFKILGSDLAGTIDAVGDKVTRFRAGDDVFGDCGVYGFGAFAEYVCVPEDALLVRKPEGLSFEQAAALPQSACIALQGIRDLAQVRPGMKVLINGGGGGTGTLAIQLAKRAGAEVTAVDGPTKLELMRSLGADRVIDYTREDFTESAERYDVILDMVAQRSVLHMRRSLTPNGVYLLGGGAGKPTAQAALLGPLLSRTGNGRVVFLLAEPAPENLTHLAELGRSGDVVPVLDACLPLAEADEALRRVGEKRALGKVILTA